MGYILPDRSQSLSSCGWSSTRQWDSEEVCEPGFWESVLFSFRDGAGATQGHNSEHCNTFLLQIHLPDQVVLEQCPVAKYKATGVGWTVSSEHGRVGVRNAGTMPVS